MTEESANELLAGEGSGTWAVVETPSKADNEVCEHEVLRFAHDDSLLGLSGFSKDRPQSRLFEAISRELLNGGNGIRFQARGASMSPAIRDGEIVHVKSAVLAELRRGDIVLVKGEMGFRLHRLMIADVERDVFITRGDCGLQDDPAVSGEEIVGIAEAKEVRVGRSMVSARLNGFGGQIWCAAARAQRVAGKLLARMTSLLSRGREQFRVCPVLVSALLVMFAATLASAQVAVDATTSSAGLSPSGTNTGTFLHTTGTGANRLLIVSIALDIVNSPGSNVSSVTYNGTALTQLGFHNDAGLTRRVEMWYLLNPVSGTNLTVAATLNVPTAGATVGAVMS